MFRRNLLYLAAVVAFLAAGAGWYWFRPERLFIDRAVSEAFDEAGATRLAGGAFHGVAHPTTGTATIYRLRTGKLMLRFSGFETSNGPDVVVYLIAAPDAGDDETVRRAESISLGSLKGNVGDQNYELPGDLDLKRFRAVTIWCRRFSVNFGTAPLS